MFSFSVASAISYSINHLLRLFGRLCCETSPCQPFLLLEAPVCAGLALFCASSRVICSMQPWHHCRKVRRKGKKKENPNVSDTPSFCLFPFHLLRRDQSHLSSPIYMAHLGCEGGGGPTVGTFILFMSRYCGILNAEVKWSNSRF